MEMLGKYKQTTELSNKDAGSCRWCFASCGGQKFFIKEFEAPKHPESDTTSTPEKKAKKLKKCEEFEQRKTKMYREINEYSDGNAVRVVELFRVGAKYYMAMPQIVSTAMTEEDISKLPEAVKRRICMLIAHSVSQLHKAQFVHSDIKHTNILFAQSQTKLFTPKLIDYDEGFFEYDPPKHSEEIGGDQVYFSPEALSVIMGNEARLTCKLDVFALGILFHQYFTGEIPGYDRNQFSCAGEAVLMGNKLCVSTAIPADIRDVICSMLEADPGQRPDLQEVYEVFSRTIKKVSSPSQKPEPPKHVPENKQGPDGRGRAGFWNMPDL